MQVNHYTSSLTHSSGTEYSLQTYNSYHAKVYYLKEGESTTAHHIDQIAKVPFWKMLIGTSEVPVSTFAKNFFSLFDKVLNYLSINNPIIQKRSNLNKDDPIVNGWTNKTSNQTENKTLNIYTNITSLDYNIFDRFPIEIKKTDLGPLNGCINVFYTSKAPKENYTASINIRVSLNGTCRIFDWQKNILLVNFLGLYKPYYYPSASEKRGKFKITLPSEIMEGDWIFEGEYKNMDFNHVFIAMAGYSLQNIVEREVSELSFRNFEISLISLGTISFIGLSIGACLGACCCIKHRASKKEGEPLLSNV